MRMDIRLHFIGLLFFLIEPVTLDKSVEGYVGGVAILPCSYSGPIYVPVTLSKENITFDWRFKNDRRIVYKVDGGVVKSDKQDKQFKNRATVLSPALETGNFSMTLTNLNENDRGRYTCTVVLYTMDTQTEHIWLTIKEKPTTEAPATEGPTPENRKNSGNISMTMGPQKTLFLLILVLMMILSV